MKGIYRNPALVLVLSVITCGLYAIYWMYCARREVRDYLADAAISPGLDLLLAIICFPFVYVWYYRMGRDVARMQTKAGLPVKDQSILLLILAFFGLGLVGNFIIQDDMNEVWKQQQ